MHADTQNIILHWTFEDQCCYHSQLAWGFMMVEARKLLCTNLAFSTPFAYPCLYCDDELFAVIVVDDVSAVCSGVNDDALLFTWP
jgi:hypothetical protein